MKQVHSLSKCGPSCNEWECEGFIRGSTTRAVCLRTIHQRNKHAGINQYQYSSPSCEPCSRFHRPIQLLANQGELSQVREPDDLLRQIGTSLSGEAPPGSVQ